MSERVSPPKVILRRQAALEGQVRYYTGRPCRKGHLTERYVCSGQCIGCLAFYSPRIKTREREITALEKIVKLLTLLRTDIKRIA